MGGKTPRRDVDPEIEEIVNFINENSEVRTLASCCGHGKYPPSIVLLYKSDNVVLEWYSQTKLSRFYKNGHVRKRWYKRDVEGYYYIPEVIQNANLV